MLADMPQNQRLILFVAKGFVLQRTHTWSPRDRMCSTPHPADLQYDITLHGQVGICACPRDDEVAPPNTCACAGLAKFCLASPVICNVLHFSLLVFVFPKGLTVVSWFTSRWGESILPIILERGGGLCFADLVSMPTTATRAMRTNDDSTATNNKHLKQQHDTRKRSPGVTGRGRWTRRWRASRPSRRTLRRRRSRRPTTSWRT